MKFDLNNDNPNGVVGGESTPVVYPRSNEDRDLSNNNKGGASVSDGPGTVNYKVGAYPVVNEETETEGSGTA